MIAVIALSASFAYAWEDFEAGIEKLKDGDSFMFTRKAGAGRIIDECRMLHYNAPEMTGVERPQGIRAKRFLAGLISGKVVLLRGRGRDRYHRLLCEVRLKDGTYVNDRMREFLVNFNGRDKYLWMEKRDAGR